MYSTAKHRILFYFMFNVYFFCSQQKAAILFYQILRNLELKYNTHNTYIVFYAACITNYIFLLLPLPLVIVVWSFPYGVRVYACMLYLHHKNNKMFTSTKVHTTNMYWKAKKLNSRTKSFFLYCKVLWSCDIYLWIKNRCVIFHFHPFFHLNFDF